MSVEKNSRCRFVLHDIRNDEIQHENGLDIFEPTIILELDERNTFETLGISGVEHPVIMRSLENFLRETLKLVQQPNIPANSEHRYWFLGTGFGLRLRYGTDITLFLDVDGKWGPVQGLSYPQSKKIGTVTPREWVQSIVAFALNLIDLFKRLNPLVYSFLKKEEFEVRELETWLSSSELRRT